MGAFQASMLEAFDNLREDFQKSLQKPREVDQTSSSAATKTNAPSNDLDKPLKASSLWRSSMAQIFRLASTRILVASKTTRVNFVVLPRIPRRLPRPNLNKHHTLQSTMLWIRALPRTTTRTILLTLNQPLVGPKAL